MLEIFVDGRPRALRVGAADDVRAAAEGFCDGVEGVDGAGREACARAIEARVAELGQFRWARAGGRAP